MESDSAPHYDQPTREISKSKTANDPIVRAAIDVRALGVMLASLLLVEYMVILLLDLNVLERRWHDIDRSNLTPFGLALLSIPCWIAAFMIRRRSRIGLIIGDFCASFIALGLFLLFVMINIALFMDTLNDPVLKIAFGDVYLISFLAASIRAIVDVHSAI